MIRIGLMGAGTVANYGHLPVLKESDRYDLYAIYEPDARRRSEMAEKFGASHATGDVEEFMNSGIEAVTITSPVPVHEANIADAARHGLPVLCEKPLAMTVPEIERITETAEKAGIPLYVGLDYRFSPVSRKIRELAVEKAIGEARSLRLVYIWNCHGRYQTLEDGTKVLNARREGRMEEGGPIVDCGVHQIDLARYWLGSEVRDWRASGAWVDAEYEAPDHVYLHMDHESGAHTTVEMSYSYCHTVAEPVNLFTYELIGTEGLIRYDRGAKLFEVRTSKETTVLPFASEKNFAGMYDAFADALEKDEPGSLATARDGLEATRIARGAVDELIRRRRESMQV